MKKIKFLVGAVTLFALVVVNVWNAATVKKATALDVEDVEAMAQESEGQSGLSKNVNRWAWQSLDNYQTVSTEFVYDDNSSREVQTIVAEMRYKCVPGGSVDCTVNTEKVQTEVHYSMYECEPNHNDGYDCHRYEPNMYYNPVISTRLL